MLCLLFGVHMKKQFANILTGFRMLCSMGLLFCPVFSIGFYVLYLFCSLSDMVDGSIARKMNAVTAFGSMLDTVADLVFMAVSVLKFLPVIRLAAWLWGWICMIATIKVCTFLRVFVTRRTTVSLHSAANKITGLCLFLLPLSMSFIDLQYSVPPVCAVATIAAIQDAIPAFPKKGAVPSDWP